MSYPEDDRLHDLFSDRLLRLATLTISQFSICKSEIQNVICELYHNGL